MTSPENEFISIEVFHDVMFKHGGGGKMNDTKVYIYPPPPSEILVIGAKGWGN